MITLTSEEKETLYEEKHITTSSFTFPSIGEFVQLSAVGKKTGTEYTIDINKKSLLISRSTLQNRMDTSIILVRLDIDTKPHRNPNGEKIGGTHIHIFDKQDSTGSWAFEVYDNRLKELFPLFNFTELSNIKNKPTEDVFISFCKLINCTFQTQMQGALFN